MPFGNDVEYSSVDLESPSASVASTTSGTMRRTASSYSNSGIPSSPVASSSATTVESTSGFFDSHTRTDQARASRYASIVRDVLSGLETPLSQLTLEIRGALLACGFAAGCYLLSWFQEVLIPFFLAIFLMYLVDPLVEVIDVSPRYFLCICTSHGRYRRRTSRGCSRAFASLCAVSLVCVFFGLLGYITVLSVHALDADAYQSGYNGLVGGIENLLNQIGLPFNITTTLHDNVDKVARTVLTQTMDLFSVMFVTIIYLTYFLCTRTRASDAGGVWSKIDNDIQRFVTLKCFLSLFVALLVTVVYVSLNVGLAIVWGILTFILNWIPNVGAMIASVAPMAIIAITPSDLMNPMEKVLAMVVPMCLHMFVGNFIEPRVLGKRLEIDPVIVILSLSAWGMLWGVVGMMLSVPLTAAVKIMLSHMQLFPQFVAVLEGTYFSKYGTTTSFKSAISAKPEPYDSVDVHDDVEDVARSV